MHHAAWPKAETYDAAAAAVSPELLTHAGEALGRAAWHQVEGQGFDKPDPFRELGISNWKRANPSKAHSAIAPRPVAWSDASPSWERPPH